MEIIDQFEACNRILRLVVNDPEKWFYPFEIHENYLSKTSMQKIDQLFNIIAIEFPEPAQVERSIKNNCWRIKKNEYTQKFLNEGGFNYKKNNFEMKKILIFSSSPYNKNRIRVDIESRVIDEVMQASLNRDSIQTIYKTAVKVDTITKAILDSSPHIVHFSGHGDFNGIVIENDLGESELLSKQKLKLLFSIFKDTVQCVILNCCYSEGQARIISELGISVIGMTNSIGDNSSIQFSRGFYQGIGNGKDIETSFKLGLIHISKQIDIKYPVLWKKGEKIKY